MKGSCVPSTDDLECRRLMLFSRGKKGHADTIVTRVGYERRNKAASSRLDIESVLAPPAQSTSHCIRNISYSRARSSAQAVDRFSACIALLSALLSAPVVLQSCVI